jgi:hypothetical protein
MKQQQNSNIISNATAMQQQLNSNEAAMPSSMPTATTRQANKKARKAIKNAKTIQAKYVLIGTAPPREILGECKQ